MTNPTDDDEQKSKVLPKQAEIISLIMQSMGVEESEPRALLQLLEFSHRTTVEFLEEASILAEHAGRTEISLEDIKLAIQQKTSVEFIGPPKRNDISMIAEEKNKIPIPLINEKYGLRLPPERHCLTQPNYRVLGKLSRENVNTFQISESNLASPVSMDNNNNNRLSLPNNLKMEDDDYDMV
jgi:transcription initiation factor TFIID subunit 9B